MPPPCPQTRHTDQFIPGQKSSYLILYAPFILGPCLIHPQRCHNATGQKMAHLARRFDWLLFFASGAKRQALQGYPTSRKSADHLCEIEILTRLKMKTGCRVISLNTVRGPSCYNFHHSSRLLKVQTQHPNNRRHVYDIRPLCRLLRPQNPCLQPRHSRL